MSNQNSDIRPGLVKYASFILNRRPYFKHALKEKLIQRCKKLKLENYLLEIDSIISDLANSGYLNDEYLAEAFVRRQISKGYGPRFIKMKLNALKLAPDVISISIDKVATIEAQMEAAKRFLQKKRYKDQRKAISSLYQRGFDQKVTRKIFDCELIED